MIQAGVFVWALFPTREEPHTPGLRHLAYCVGTAPSHHPKGIARAALAYTTTVIPGLPYPVGVRVFSLGEARVLGQHRPFALHIGTIAVVPVRRIWFPDLDQPGEGIVAAAPVELQRELAGLLTRTYARHPYLIETRGPGVS